MVAATSRGHYGTRCEIVLLALWAAADLRSATTASSPAERLRRRLLGTMIPPSIVVIYGPRGLSIGDCSRPRVPAYDVAS